jgi:hypothetical protein
MTVCPRCGHRFDEQLSLTKSPLRPLVRDDPIAKVRTSDPDTSRRAAFAIYPTRHKLRWRILVQFADEQRRHNIGLTDNELSLRMPDVRLNSLTTRRSELYLGGWLEDSGIRRKTDAGIEAIVWRLSEAGSIAWRRERDVGH